MWLDCGWNGWNGEGEVMAALWNLHVLWETGYVKQGLGYHSIGRKWHNCVSVKCQSVSQCHELFWYFLDALLVVRLTDEKEQY